MTRYLRISRYFVAITAFILMFGSSRSAMAQWNIGDGMIWFSTGSQFIENVQSGPNPPVTSWSIPVNVPAIAQITVNGVDGGNYIGGTFYKNHAYINCYATTDSQYITILSFDATFSGTFGTNWTPTTTGTYTVQCTADVEIFNGQGNSGRIYTGIEYVPVT